MDYSSFYSQSGNMFQGQTGFAGVPSHDCESKEMMFQDPNEVQQWAAASATLATDDVANMSRDISLKLEASISQDGMFCDQLPARTTSPGCASNSTGTTHSESFDTFGMDSYPFQNFAIRSEDMAQPMAQEDFWSNAQYLSTEDLPGLSSDQSWSSPSTVSLHPSLSSSLPQSGFFHGYVSPTFSGQEDMSSTTSLDEPVLSPLALEPTQNMFGSDASSTLRPTHGFPRPQVSFWNESLPPAMGAQDMYTMYRKPSSDGENTARSHELYQVGPTEGLYHCPFVKEGSCKHKPEKLKCNYDKHLDAHLKPYRCKSIDCKDVPFSSTACLLRHEREAHGMHGHGDKPYLCTYEDCDRAVQGNGFPRRWNLQDHMKRVHDYTGPPSDKALDAKATLRKKRSPAASTGPKRIKSGTVSKATAKASMPSRQKMTIQKNMQDQVAPAQEYLDAAGDVFGTDQFLMMGHSALPMHANY